MDRNITAKGQASRTRLLETAARLFAEKGYQKTKISDIVKAAGLTQAAFYLYFPSKEAIFAELVDDFRMNLHSLAETAKKVTPLVPAEVPRQVVNNLKQVFAYLSTNPELTKIAWYESPDSEQIKHELIQMIAGNIRINQEAGHIRKQLVPEIVAEILVGIVDRLTIKWLLTNQKSPEELAEEMAEVVMYGILAYSPE